MEKTGVVIGWAGLTAAGGRDGVVARWVQQPGRRAARKPANLLEAISWERDRCF